MRGLLAGIALLLTAACSDSAREQSADGNNSCFAELQFENEDARRTFLRDNAETLVSLASAGDGQLYPDAREPKEYLFVASPCADFEASYAGLRIPEGAVTGASAPDFDEGVSFVPAGSWRREASDQDTPSMCVVRFFPPPQNAGPLMNVLAASGLRSQFVGGSDDGLFGSYEEPCDLVESHVAIAMEQLGPAWPPPIFCASVSLSQCGYGGNVRVEYPD